MDQTSCRENKMTDATITDSDELVTQAKHWSSHLLTRVHTGPGDTVEAAMYRAEQKYGIPAQAFWALRYRTPKDIMASVYLRLKAAYEHECERQEARLRHELEMAKALTGNPTLAAAISEAEAALGSSVNATQTQGEAAE